MPMAGPVLAVSTSEAERCFRCRGTGSGLYNAMSAASTCEVCGGSGAEPVRDPNPPQRPVEARP